MEDKSQKKKLTLTVPLDVHAKLTKEAERQNRSVHNLLLTMIRDYFDKQESNSAPSA